MKKITVGQFLAFTNVYVPVCIEDEFQRYEGRGRSGMKAGELSLCVLTEVEKECPIDYIRNVDGGHFGDDKKRKMLLFLVLELKTTKNILVRSKLWKKENGYF
jgi:hypothetical protein